MGRIVGTKMAKELTLTRMGANQHADVLLRKSLANPTPAAPATNHGNPDMDLNVAKRLAGMNEVTKAHFLALDDEKATAFLAKSATDQDSEAAEAKKSADAAAQAAEAAKAAAGENTHLATKVASLETTVGTLTDAVKTLTGQLTEKSESEEIAKAYAGDYAGFPGGLEALRPALKAAFAMPEGEARTAVQNALKAQAQMAKTSGRTFGLTDEASLEKAAPELAAVNKEASERAAKKSITHQQALAEMSMDPAWADRVMAAEHEQIGLN